MGEWKINGSDASALGLRVESVRRGAPWVDEATLVANDDFLAADTLADGAAVVITHPDGTVMLRGKVRGRPREAGGNEEARTYRVKGPWDELARTTYKQIFKAAETHVPTVPEPWDFELVDYWSSNLWLGIVNGAAVDTAGQISAAVGYAHTEAGVALTLGSLAFTAVPLQAATLVDENCARVVQAMMRWHPDVSAWVDYTSGAVLNFANLAGLTTTTLGLTSTDFKTVALAPRDDMKPGGIVLIWRRAVPYGSGMLVEIHKDIYPGGASENAPGVVCHTVDLDADANNARPETADVVTRPLPEDGETSQALLLKFWKHEVPWLEDLKETDGLVWDDLKFEGHTMDVIAAPTADEMDAPTPPDLFAVDWNADPATYPRALVRGTIPDWLLQQGIEAAPMRATVSVSMDGATPGTAKQKRIFGADGKRKVPIVLEFTGTTATTRRYQGLPGGGAAPPDFPADGLAETLYNQRSTVRYEGTVSIEGDDCPLPLLPGQKLAISGGLAAWSTMNAPVWEMNMQPQAGRTTWRVGPLGTLSLQDMVEIQRRYRNHSATGADVTYQTEAKAVGKTNKGHEELVNQQKASKVKDTPPEERILPAFKLTADKVGDAAATGMIHPGKFYWQARILRPIASVATAETPDNKIKSEMVSVLGEDLTEPREVAVGEVWLNWDTDENGDVQNVFVVMGDPGTETNYDPKEGTNGNYKTQIGEVHADGSVTQILRSDFFWNGVALKEEDDGTGSGEDDTETLELMSYLADTSCACSCSCDGSGSGGSGGSGGGSCSCSITVAWYYYKIKIPKAWIVSGPLRKSLPA